MEKVYIVSNTNCERGYHLDDILTVFSTREKATDFFNMQKERIMKRNQDINVLTDKYNETYFYAENDDNYWYEILLIEKILN